MDLNPRRQFRAKPLPRRAFLSAAALALLPRVPARADQTRPASTVGVLYESGVEAYIESVNGLKEGLSRQFPNLLLVDLKSSSEALLAEAIHAGSDRLLITVGAEALSAAASSRAAVLIPTMILKADRPAVSPAARRGAAVYLDIQLPAIVNELRGLFPERSRFGILHNPSRLAADPSIALRNNQPDLKFHTAECARPEDLVKAFLSLRGKADFVILFPDSALYNSTTLKPLILASLENRLPVVGFSASFVRAGAAAGVYPDFRDIGAQTAELAQRYMAVRSPLPDENPRKLLVAVNQRVLRLLGLVCKQTPGLTVYR
jgi:putative tryptophan/tyrosine transport system substrate-binding protein